MEFVSKDKNMIVYEAMGAITGMVDCSWISDTEKLNRIKEIIEAYTAKRKEMLANVMK
jgi:hypothetical protein